MDAPMSSGMAMGPKKCAMAVKKFRTFSESKVKCAAIICALRQRCMTAKNIIAAPEIFTPIFDLLIASA
jgi:hypothetical protein